MSTAKVDIIHSLPGRLRVKIQELRGRKNFFVSLENAFRKLPHIKEIEANSRTGKALIIFDYHNVNNDIVLKKLQSAIKIFLSREGSSRVRSKDESSSRGNVNLPKYQKEIFEPEDLPIKTQVLQVVGTGIILGGILLKRVIWGKSTLASTAKVNTLATITTIVTGYPILRSGLESLFKQKKLNNDFLISSATLVSLALRESITGLVVVWLVNLSTLFQTLTLDKSRKAIKEMLQGKEENVWVEVEGTLVSVPIKDLQVDNIIATYLGDKIPIDGAVVSGEAAVSQAIITGESMPITKKAGDKVFAGSIVEQGELKIRAEKVGEDTSLARIIHMVEEAGEVRAPIENMADKYSDKIVPLSFALAGLIYLLTGDYKRSMTMLIVACPCAAGLATPTAISAAIGNAARKGILIKGGSHLEKIGQTDVVLFDKTGTLTEGRPTVREVMALTKTCLEEKVIQLAASLEAQTNHPLAKAINDYADKLKLELLPVTDKEVIIGHGVKAQIDGNLILVGSERLMHDHEVNITKGKTKGFQLTLLGQTVLYVSRDKTLLGIIAVSDKVRADTPRAIRRLREEGIDTIGLITGDCTETGEMVGTQLGLDNIWCETLPEEKVEIVKKYQDRGQVVTMVGEGINDSPALARADVGVAMGAAGTDVAIESADVVLAGDKPTKVPELINLSNTTMEIVKQNFTFAVGINALGLILGAGKLISPLSAAILHNLSTFGVVVNSSRLLNYRLKKRGKTSWLRLKS